MPSRWIRIEPSVLKRSCVVIKKAFVLSVVLNIMVDKGSLLSCVVVVVVVIIKLFGVWDNIGASATRRMEDRDSTHRDEIAVSRQRYLKCLSD